MLLRSKGEAYPEKENLKKKEEKQRKLGEKLREIGEERWRKREKRKNGGRRGGKVDKRIN